MARASELRAADPTATAPVSTDGRWVRDRWRELRARLAAPVSGASLAFLRISMGLLMALEAWALCRSNPAAISMGTTPIETYFAGSEFSFHFPYAGFAWLPLLPTAWMYGLALLLGAAGLTLALGLRTRESSVIVFVVWAYFFAVESTRSYWQSHYYIELLFTFLLVWMPTGRRFSLDALIARRRGEAGPRTVPFWTLFVLRGQLVIAYFYAGVAKLNWDWLADAIPVRWFLAEPSVTAPYEALLSTEQLAGLRAVLHSEWFAYFLSYAGLGFDLAVGFLFLVRRTRMFALAAMLIFHGTNHLLIFDDIDWFPLAGATTALIFLDADWPIRVWKWLRRPRLGKPDWGWLVGGGIAVPLLGALLGWRVKARALPATEAAEQHRPGRLTVIFVSSWLIWQAFMPLRHYLIPGDGRFTYEGLSFSWRLKADRHSARGAILIVRDEVILNATAGARAAIDWQEWRWDRLIHRRVTPGRIDWRTLPEIVVTLQPLVGERVFYNPFARGNAAIPDAAARQRGAQLWQDIYGRPPNRIDSVLSLKECCVRATALLTDAGLATESAGFREFEAVADAIDRQQLEPAAAARMAAHFRGMLREALGHSTVRPALIELLALTGPFALDGEPQLPAPFLIIEDTGIMHRGDQPAATVDYRRWKSAPATRGSEGRLYSSSPTSPTVVYTSELGTEAGIRLPPAFILDFHGSAQPPAIFWNSLKDLSPSKSIHISNQAFFLRRYAIRVADLWEARYGRRPVINALTAVSLNGRPHQELVDPHADLARVSVKWFGHNEWVRDLQLKRIPREVVRPGADN